MNSLGRMAGRMSSALGRGGYSESGFLEEEDGNGAPPKAAEKPSRRISIGGSSRSPKKEEAKTREKADTWDQAASIRAQLEEELKREQSRLSPSQQPAATSTAGKKTSHKKSSHKKGSPDLLFAVATPGLQSPFDAVPHAAADRESGDPWQASPGSASPTPEAAAAKPAAKPAPASAPGAFGGIWDPAPATAGSFAWPQKATPAPAQAPAAQPPSSSPVSAAAAATSLADGFAAPGVADGFQWGNEDSPSGEADKVMLPAGSPPVALPMAPATASTPGHSRRNSDASEAMESCPGMFDDAILAALGALPQQALVGVLQRLARRRPAEVALAFGLSSNSSPSVRAASVQPEPALPAVQPVLPAVVVRTSRAEPEEAVDPAPAIALAATPIALGAPPIALGAPAIALGAPPIALGAPPIALGAPPIALGAPSSAQPAAIVLGGPPVIAEDASSSAVEDPEAVVETPVAEANPFEEDVLTESMAAAASEASREVDAEASSSEAVPSSMEVHASATSPSAGDVVSPIAQDDLWGPAAPASSVGGDFWGTAGASAAPLPVGATSPQQAAAASLWPAAPEASTGSPTAPWLTAGSGAPAVASLWPEPASGASSIWPEPAAGASTWP